MKLYLKSPCIGHCRLNKEKQICEGCKRTIKEITLWHDLSEEEREKVLTGQLKFD